MTIEGLGPPIFSIFQSFNLSVLLGFRRQDHSARPLAAKRVVEEQERVEDREEQDEDVPVVEKRAEAQDRDREAAAEEIPGLQGLESRAREQLSQLRVAVELVAA